MSTTVVCLGVIVAEVTPELADGLYKATGGDIEFNMTNGVAYFEFDRSATSLDQAITSAIVQVEGVRAEPKTAVYAARLAMRLLGFCDERFRVPVHLER